MLRIAILASSHSSLIRATSLWRTSADKGGILIRISLPSLCGLRPRSLARIPFSMSLSVLGSKGLTTSWFGSGALTEAIALIGVGDP